MNYYVLRPDLTPYEGIKVDKDTVLSFENDKVSQEVKDLKLIVKSKDENEKYTITSEMVVNLEEGEVLLFEGEDRGYFLPAQAIGTLETAIKDYSVLATQLDGVDYEVVKK